jgi:hypothetical protein
MWTALALHTQSNVTMAEGRWWTTWLEILSNLHFGLTKAWRQDGEYWASGFSGSGGRDLLIAPDGDV